ncbi:MFS transporter [Sphaerochaeta sp. PS]|uniref:MFS transporter n=1 Tax=Sphaerochaeta sp. PS TaxID=3076336 RepID=UPI0028A448AE|nr:MFS transporter [Sphaerochaeta sp. PS]MDT4761725.1 MFS transporter [Sphaerochaeta sp. PS]
MDKQQIQRRNYAAFLVHAFFLALTMNFIDINTVVPNMLAESGATALHMGILSSIMIGGASFMQLLFAGIIFPLKRKKPALLAGIYLRVAALMALGIFVRTLSGTGLWKVWTILALMTLFSFSGAFANISYTDILGRTIEATRRKRLLTVKQLIASVGVIASALLVKVILSSLSYPRNYATLFLLAGGLLMLATIGFWMIREEDAPMGEQLSLSQRFAAFGKVIKEDRNMRLYLLLINTSGVILSTIPFLILYARTRFPIDGSLTGTFLLVQMAGSLLANTLLTFFSQGQRYRRLLYLFVALAFATPLIALLSSASPLSFSLVFLLTGSTSALYQIVAPGVLLEISTDENRPLYAGLAGAGSLMNILYPILAGFLVPVLGFGMVFALTSIYILLGIYAAFAIRCERIS